MEGYSTKLDWHDSARKTLAPGVPVAPSRKRPGGGRRPGDSRRPCGARQGGAELAFSSRDRRDVADDGGGPDAADPVGKASCSCVGRGLAMSVRSTLQLLAIALALVSLVIAVVFGAIFALA